MEETPLTEYKYTLEGFINFWWKCYSCAKASQDKELIERMKIKCKAVWNYQKMRTKQIKKERKEYDEYIKLNPQVYYRVEDSYTGGRL
jgi:hypothetical protein